jgi:6,7-dimethyl-8-ribityllumazine synthase
MASKGNKAIFKGIPQLKDAFVVIIKTAWNKHIVDPLEDGAARVLNKAGIAYKTYDVPGAVEIPFAVRQYFLSGQKTPDAFITLGAVIKGGTPHFEYVCKSVTEGITNLNLTLPVPVIFGVLTLDDEKQGKERIGGIHGHKGEESALTALKMIRFYRELAKVKSTEKGKKKRT